MSGGPRTEVGNTRGAARTHKESWTHMWGRRPAPHKLSNGTKIRGTKYGSVGPPTRTTGPHAILMSGKSRLSHSFERDNLRPLRDSGTGDKVWAESDVPHVPGECPLPAHVDPL
eukprot:366116-Chlamydomonas_euryale.AAC.8